MKTSSDSPLSSRKLWISILATVLSCSIPIAYKSLGIADSVTMSVLGIVSALAIGYGGLNILDKKIANDK